MPFRFKKKESVARAVRRLCCERLDEALETLEKVERLDAVHNVRKEIKKLRSILRLMRRDIGRDTYSRHTEVLREAARLLMDFRDAQVKLNAFDSLAKHFRRNFSASQFAPIRSALAKECLVAQKKLRKSMAPLKRILSRSRNQIGDLKIKGRGWKAIAPGLKKIYGRGKDAFETALLKPSPPNFHEWRKRVKDLWYELRLLCPANPRRLKIGAARFGKLGDLLGDDHDLFMLKEFASNKNSRMDHKDRFETFISSRQSELRSAGLKLGRKLYREKPAHFCRQIGKYWKDWRG